MPRMHTLEFWLPVGMHDSDRQSDAKCSAFSLSATGCGHGPAMKFHEIAHDGETQPESGVLAVSRAVGLAKPLEDVRQKIGPDAHARVAHDDFHAGVHTLEVHLNAPILR